MSFLYDLIIQPLVVVIDAIFSLAFGVLENTVASLFALSIVVNLLVLPLYRKADLLQKEQHEKALKMKKWTDHIRKTFHGDERFMMLSEYYRIEGYSPFSTFKEAVPLLLQVPFFIAAYRYISNLPYLKYSSFGPIKSLLFPDRLVSIAGITINVLPIIMTLINMLSGYFYTKGMQLRQKIQTYGLAVVFLVLLYNSPSGLVFYWIMNNLFSLFKNLIDTKLNKYSKHITVILSFIVIVVIITEMALLNVDRDVDVLAVEITLAYVIVNLIITAMQLSQDKPVRLVERFRSLLPEDDRKTMIAKIILPELCLVMFLGFFIPSSVVASSPLEFIDNTNGSFRTDLLFYSAVVYAGLFLIWTTVMILSRDGKKRQFMIYGLWAVLGISLFNQFLAPVNTGALHTDLTFDTLLYFNVPSVILNIILSLIAAAVMVIIALKTRNVYKHIAVVASAVMLVLFAANIINVNKELKQSVREVRDQNITEFPITLSRTGKNVVVIMLDRAIGSYVPYIFDEKPELKESFRGFVHYPNTVSYGVRTNYGSPGLFGGYEYTPYEMNKRSNELLKDKHNEALKVMPVMFMNEGYQVTVCDPPYANYQEIPDLSIYDEYPEIKAYNLTGRYTQKMNADIVGDVEYRQKHNFLIYGFFRCVPSFMKNAVYDDGRYLSAGAGAHLGYSSTMLDNYSTMWNLPNITTITDADKGCFLMMQNETPHNPTLLNPPDYPVNGMPYDYDLKYKNKVHDGRVMKIENGIQWGHYCINLVSYREVAKWLDFLKEQDVYDNTRIILVADHGYPLRQFQDLIHPTGLDIESFNPLLMVKDFNSNAEFSSDNSFMTNADVATLATAGVIKDPTNPFTGVPVDDRIKRSGPVIVTDSNNWVVSSNNGTRFDLADGKWWLVHDGIFDMNNWTVMDKENAS